MPLDRFPGNASWLEIDAGRLTRNAATLRGLVGPGSKLGAVIKANAYGHGLAQVLPALHAATDVLYVITPQDALAVRAFEAERGLAARQVLVLGAIVPDEAVALARAGVDAVVADRDFAAAVPVLREAGVRLRAHVHVDTGLGREGFTVDGIARDAAFLTHSRDVVQVAGVLSHFANTEDVTEQEYARQQLSALEKGHSAIQSLLDSTAPIERHVAASAAAMLLPEARQHAVRLGIAMYGLWPSSETRLSARMVFGSVPKLEPVLSWRCASQVVKWLSAGSFVGYGCTYRCPQDTRVAVLPVGYFDGYPRLVSSRGHVLVNGQRCPVLGRVMMNHVVVDVTRAVGDEAPVVATLLGDDRGEHVSAETLGAWAQTINYEIVARLGGHLRRVVTGA